MTKLLIALAALAALGGVTCDVITGFSGFGILCSIPPFFVMGQCLAYAYLTRND